MEKPTTSNLKEQEQRAILRERFLRVISALGGKEIKMRLHERTSVSGKFRAMKADITHYVVDGLKTPIGIVPHAIIRMSDTISISCDIGSFDRPSSQK
ncbi:hypothetical protein AB6A40_011253 [Gnathostoma spinigerum]|uniref:Gem-associated protein 7 n=1 Tax=Gnathostoma spinigerum TaxID=75299 RepID=A0ABD6F326_9BILA